MKIKTFFGLILTFREENYWKIELTQQIIACS